MVDRELAQLYGLEVDALDGIRDEMGPSPADYSDEVEIDPEVLARLYTESMSELIAETIKLRGAGRHLAMKNYVVDRRLELICHYLKAHPRAVIGVLKRLGRSRPGRDQTQAEALLSYLVGAAFGRWDVSKFGVSESSPDAWAPVVPTPPGLLVALDGLPARTTPSEYPIRLPPDGILVDDPGHDWDMAGRVTRTAATIFGSTNELDEAVRSIEAAGLREYLNAHFFDRHLAQYSESRRKAPIYWHLGVRSGTWSVWFYYPSLTRDSLFAIWRAAQDKLRRSESAARDLEERLAGKAGERDARERFEALESLMDELRSFVASAESVAKSGWEPNLNDGAALCAAPLEPLIAPRAWWREAARRATELKAGKYPWSSVQCDFFGVES